MLKKNKGITLIALVVTIIVLIILAGISINLLLGDNGIIKKAQEAGERYKTASNEEEVRLSDLDSQIQSVLDGNGFQGGSGGDNNDNNSTAITGVLGAPVNTLNYGEKVTNYTAAGLVWRLFYEDSNNVYLISETQDGDYPISSIALVNSDHSAKGNYSSGADVSQQGKELMPLLGGQATSSAGTVSIGTNSNGTNEFTSSNTNTNILELAYLCDTRVDGPWATYKTGSAAWAMGGPTIELFAASYNATHTNHQILLGIDDYYGGYTDNTDLDWFLTRENHGIYRLKSSGQWWIAGTYGYGNELKYVNENRGDLHRGPFTYGSFSARPVVCISKSTGFICQFENGPRTGTLGAPVNTDKYGREVTNYTAAGLRWRLFYEDSNNIYLISETTSGGYPLNNVQTCNYANNTYSPKDASYVSGESVSQQGKDLMPLAGGATTSSAGTITIGTNTNGINLFTSGNTNPNIWGTAFLCDTTKWTAYKTEQAAWAMGGPTIELFAASYNATHTNYQMAIEIQNNTKGYSSHTDSDWFSVNENHGIYRLTNSGHWWISSPCSNNDGKSLQTVSDYAGGMRTSNSTAAFERQ